MVQMMRSSDGRSGMGMPSVRGDYSVKIEPGDSFEESNGARNKRAKFSSSFDQQWSTETNEFAVPPSPYKILAEPSPLGLRLKKSPSLLDLIQTKLSQSNASSLDAGSSRTLSVTEKKDGKGNSSGGATDKLKASNFAASRLKIGRWEYVSKHDGDLVAKCYFAKHKLVWEILDGGLKSKIEIQWSDITALTASCPDNGPGTLIVVLSKQPLFFRETNPQPRKHTLWQVSADFTDGEASLNRQHLLQCQQGTLIKHYEKLIQCDARLNLLSQQPELVLDSPYFEAQGFVSGYQDKLNQLEIGKGSPVSSFSDTATAQSSSFKIEQQDPIDTAYQEFPKHLLQAPSPSSVMDSRAMEVTEGFEEGGSKFGEQLKVPGIRPSMSMSDMVNYVGHCVSEQVASGNPSYKKASESQEMIENIANILLSDTQSTIASDEKYLMSRVNSLCCLLQDPVAISNPQVDGESHSKGHEDEADVQFNHASKSVPEDMAGGELEALEGNDPTGVLESKQAPTISRKDSYVELLSNLPRIASLPGILFDISEDRSFV